MIAIIAIFASGTVIWFFGYQRQAELDSATKNIVNTLRDANARSVSGKDFKSWGVYFDTVGNKYVLFRNEGGGYATATVKEESYMSNYVKISVVTLNGGGNEIIFNKSAGDTAQYGTIKIEQAGTENNFKYIMVSSLGKIDSQ